MSLSIIDHFIKTMSDHYGVDTPIIEIMLDRDAYLELYANMSGIQSSPDNPIILSDDRFTFQPIRGNRIVVSMAKIEKPNPTVKVTKPESSPLLYYIAGLLEGFEDESCVKVKNKLLQIKSHVENYVKIDRITKRMVSEDE